MRHKIQELKDLAEEGNWTNFVQFIKFGLVGVSNTLISYGTEMLCYYLIFVNVVWAQNVKIAVISSIAFIISVTNSYYWNNRYVFKSSDRNGLRLHLRAYLKTVLCYGITGLVLAPLLKMWITAQGIPYWASSLLTLIVTIPLNFVLNKFWAFAE